MALRKSGIRFSSPLFLGVPGNLCVRREERDTGYRQKRGMFYGKRGQRRRSPIARVLRSNTRRTLVMT